MNEAEIYEQLPEAPLGFVEEEKDEMFLHLDDMCQKAKERHKRYAKEKKFKEMLKELNYVPFAVYLYSKLEGGSETDSTYLNDLYLFKRVSKAL